MWYLLGGLFLIVLAYGLSVRVNTTLVWTLCAVPFVVGVWLITLVVLASLRISELSKDDSLKFTLIVLIVWAFIMTEGSAKLVGTLIIVVCMAALISLLDPHAKQILLTGWERLLQVLGPIGKILQQIPNP